MYTRKLTTKTKARKGKRTIGKRVGKSVNKKRFGKKSMRKSVNKNKKRNNNRRTKRAGFNALKYAANSVNPNLGLGSAAILGAKAAGLGASNVKAGYDAYKILNNKNLTPEEKFAKGKNIAGDALKNNLKFGEDAIKTFVDTDKVKSDANKYANKYGVPNPLGIVKGTQAQFNPRNQAHPQLGQPRVPAGYPQLGQPGVYPRIV